LLPILRFKWTEYLVTNYPFQLKWIEDHLFPIIVAYLTYAMIIIGIFVFIYIRKIGQKEAMYRQLQEKHQHEVEIYSRPIFATIETDDQFGVDDNV